MSHSTEELFWGTLSCFKIFRVSKYFMQQRRGGGGGITFPRRVFFVSQYPKYLLQNTSELQKFLGINLFCASEWGVSRFSVELFCLTVLKYSLGNTSLLRKYSVIEGFFASEGGGEKWYHVSPSKFFVLQYRKTSFGNISVLQKFSGIGAFYASKSGLGLSRFSVETFSLTILKNFFREHRCVKKLQGLETFLHKKLVSQFYFKIFLSPCRKSSKGSPFVFQKILLSKKFMHKRWGERIRFCRKNLEKLCLAVPKTFLGIPSRFQKN